MMAAYMNLASKYSLPDTELAKKSPTEKVTQFRGILSHCVQWVKGFF